MYVAGVDKGKGGGILGTVVADAQERYSGLIPGVRIGLTVPGSRFFGDKLRKQGNHRLILSYSVVEYCPYQLWL